MTYEKSDSNSSPFISQLEHAFTWKRTDKQLSLSVEYANNYLKCSWEIYMSASWSLRSSGEYCLGDGDLRLLGGTDGELPGLRDLENFQIAIKQSTKKHLRDIGLVSFDMCFLNPL